MPMRWQQKFSAGGDTAKQAFQETIAALASMENPLEQNTAGVDLFGTMWEDLGPEAVTALASIEDGAYDTAGAMQQIKDIKYDDIGSVFEGLKRSLEVLIVPLGEQLIPLLAELIDDTLPLLEDALPPIIDAVSDVIEALQPAIEDVLPVLIDSLADIGEPLMDLVNEILPVLLSAINDILPLAAQLVGEILPVITNLLSMLLPPLVEIISALLPPLIELVSALMPICESLIGVLQPILDLFTSLLTPIVNLISQGLTPLVNAITPVIQIISSLLIPILNSLGSVFSSVLSGMLSNTTSIIGNITKYTEKLNRLHQERIYGKIGVEHGKNVKTDFSAMRCRDWLQFLRLQSNAIVDGWNGLAGSLGSVTIPDWVPGIGGGSWSLPKMHRMKIGMDYVPYDLYPAYLDEGEWVLTKEEADVLRSYGGLEGMIGMIDRSAPSVNVSVQGQSKDFDYEKFGRATVDAMIAAGIGFKCDDREFARLIKDLIDYV